MEESPAQEMQWVGTEGGGGGGGQGEGEGEGVVEGAVVGGWTRVGQAELKDRAELPRHECPGRKEPHVVVPGQAIKKHTMSVM